MTYRLVIFINLGNYRISTDSVEGNGDQRQKQHGGGGGHGCIYLFWLRARFFLQNDVCPSSGNRTKFPDLTIMAEGRAECAPVVSQVPLPASKILTHHPTHKERHASFGIIDGNSKMSSIDFAVRRHVGLRWQLLHHQLVSWPAVGSCRTASGAIKLSSI